MEGDYLDLGSHTDQYFGGTGSVHSDAQAFAAYAVGFLPLPIPFLDIYGKAGLANWRLHQDTNLAPGDFFHYSDNGTDFAWGVGGQVHFGNVGARLEYESFRCRKHQWRQGDLPGCRRKPVLSPGNLWRERYSVLSKLMI